MIVENAKEVINIDFFQKYFTTEKIINVDEFLLDLKLFLKDYNINTLNNEKEGSKIIFQVSYRLYGILDKIINLNDGFLLNDSFSFSNLSDVCLLLVENIGYNNFNFKKTQDVLASMIFLKFYEKNKEPDSYDYKLCFVNDVTFQKNFLITSFSNDFLELNVLKDFSKEKYFKIATKDVLHIFAKVLINNPKRIKDFIEFLKDVPVDVGCFFPLTMQNIKSIMNNVLVEVQENKKVLDPVFFLEVLNCAKLTEKNILNLTSENFTKIMESNIHTNLKEQSLENLKIALNMFLIKKTFKNVDNKQKKINI